jgi:hypothetical protein
LKVVSIRDDYEQLLLKLNHLFEKYETKIHSIEFKEILLLMGFSSKWSMNPDKDYWTHAVVLTTSNNSFGPTEISYLENKFTNMAKSANRYIVKNSNDPTPGNITEEKESELEEFIEYAQIVIGTLGYNVFKSLTATKPTIEDNIAKIEDTIDSTHISPTMVKRHGSSNIINVILQEDILFNSPSNAAIFVLGKSSNGWVEWKTIDGKTLNEIKR